MNDAPIGIFDSGIGGLTVLRELFRKLPSEGTIYLGDTARVPYGIRSRETIIRYSLESMGFLLKKGVKLLVIACNTASAISLNEVKKHCPVPVIGVISPGAKAALRASRNKKIGVIGTEATIKSRSYINTIKALDGSASVFSKPCPLFVPLAEEGWTDNEIAGLTAKKYLNPFKDKGIDTLLLGCTHYPLLKDAISSVIGKNISLIDSAVETAKETEGILKKYKIQAKNRKNPLREFYVTDSTERFKLLGERFLAEKIKDIKLIRLDMEV